MCTCKKPLKRSFLIGTLAFILLLSAVLSLTQYVRYRRMLYHRYELYIENVLNLAAGAIDTDDLAACMRTGVESEKYQALQSFLDSIRDRMDIHFIYIIEPLNTEPVDNIRNVIAGVSREEYETIPDQLVYLNKPTGTSYSPETAAKYLRAYESGKLSFFEEISEWGDDYTGLLPLFDSEGNRVAALCVDVDAAGIHRAVRENTLHTILVIVVLSLSFAALFGLWAVRNITRPIEQLESSVTAFAASCQNQEDPEALRLRVADIHTGNEVESLACAVTQMSEAMQSYVKRIVLNKSELARMAALANTDALTGVRNKNAYNTFAIELQAKMRAGGLRFAALMADLNELKRINDSFGHEQGDRYIQRCCQMLCRIFAHSAVFRIGGDEFALVLLGEDYENRQALVEQARDAFRSTENDESLPPWERCGAAIGMAIYREGRDESLDEVLSRADKSMYREKEKSKAGE